MRIVILGLSITSSWGNGHATTYRGLVRALTARGHDLLFLERDVPWYAENRDLPHPPFCRFALYSSLDDLRERFVAEICEADLLLVGSYVPDGAAVGAWGIDTAQGITAFYDIDTPVTLQNLARGECAYLTPDLVGRYDMYLSFTGGPILKLLQDRYRARMARTLYCAVDPDLYFREQREQRYDLGYMGTYSVDRQPVLDRLLIKPARLLPDQRFVVAGAQYPTALGWPANVLHIEHLPPSAHRAFYNEQRFTLNVTRADMVRAGYAPSVRLFEAAACGTPVISDSWVGLESFFVPGREILLAHGPEDAVRMLCDLSDAERQAIGAAARARVLAAHTSEHRAIELEGYVHEAQRG